MWIFLDCLIMYIHNFLEFLCFQSCQLITLRQNAKIRIILGSVYTANNTWQFCMRFWFTGNRRKDRKSGDLEQGTDKVPMKPVFLLRYLQPLKKKIGERRGQDKRKKHRNLKILDFGNQLFFAEIGDRTQMLAQHLSLFVNILRA